MSQRYSKDEHVVPVVPLSLRLMGCPAQEVDGVIAPGKIRQGGTECAAG